MEIRVTVGIRRRAEGNSGIGVKVAVTETGPLIVTVVLTKPEAPSLQPAKLQPAALIASILTTEPEANVWLPGTTLPSPTTYIVKGYVS